MSTLDFIKKYWFLMLTTGIFVVTLMYFGDVSRGYKAIGGEDALLIAWLIGWCSLYMVSEEK